MSLSKNKHKNNSNKEVFPVGVRELERRKIRGNHWLWRWSSRAQARACNPSHELETGREWISTWTLRRGSDVPIPWLWVPGSLSEMPHSKCVLFYVAKFVLVFVDAVGKTRNLLYTSKLSLTGKSNVRLFVSWLTFLKAVWLSILSSLDLAPFQMLSVDRSGTGWRDQTWQFSLDHWGHRKPV